MHWRREGANLCAPDPGTCKRLLRKTRQAAPIGATALSSEGILELAGFGSGPIAFVWSQKRLFIGNSIYLIGVGLQLTFPIGASNVGIRCQRVQRIFQMPMNTNRGGAGRIGPIAECKKRRMAGLRATSSLRASGFSAFPLSLNLSTLIDDGVCTQRFETEPTLAKPSPTRYHLTHARIPARLVP